MQRITFYALMAVVALVAPIGGQTAPQVKIREVATIPGVAIGDLGRLPNGRVVLYTVGDSIFSYDLAAKRATLLTRGFDGNLRVSPAGDRIAFFRDSEDGKTPFIWAMSIDPATGAAAGPAQRVSLSPGDTPGFSPDGKLIAFALFPPGGGNDLTVVPSPGGAERTLAKYRNLRTAEWSDDGKSILVVHGEGRASTVERVPVAGGPSEKLISFSGQNKGQIGGRVAFFHPDGLAQSEGRIAYRTTSGAEGEFRIPIQCPADSSFPACSVGGLVESGVSLWRRMSRPSAVRVLNMADGTTRELLPQAESSRAPMWSPDGRRIALQDSVNGQFAITVMNADGSGRRRYPVSNPRDRHMRWSPNGRVLAYYVAPGQLTVAALDLETGVSRVLSKAPAGRFFWDFVWRPDSKSIVLALSSPAGDPRTEVFEARLDGAERKLLDLPRSGPNRFISDELMWIHQPEKHAVISLADGAVRELPGTPPRLNVSSVSGDGQQLFWSIHNADGSMTSAQTMTTGGESLRTLSLPFAVDQAFPFSFIHPDGRHGMLVGKVPGEGASRVYLVPLNGDTPRSVTQVSGRVQGLWWTPDGKTLLYALEGTPTTTIYEVDATEILQAISRR